ncbi:MAG: sugar ABC transporter permease [Chloroflexota bacterium]|nr:sugar ABC transporter permease [Chloroflexota bacterium]
MTALPATPIREGGGKGKVGVRRRIGEHWFIPYLFVLPHLLVFALMIGWPFFYGLWISMLDADAFSGAEAPFVGVENYAQLFDAGSTQFGRFWQTLWNTVLFVIMSVPTLIAIALVLAALLNEKFRARNVFRAIYFAPWTLGVSVIGLLWFWVFFNNGLATSVVEFFGIEAPTWLSSQPWAWITILIATVWWTIGFNTIILLAGMQAISVDLYEAARVDGANKWQQFRNITVPSLKPILLLVVTLQVIASFNLVGQPQIITNGGPPTAQTTPVLLHLYNVGFRSPFDIGLAAAMAVVVAVVMVIVSVINFRFFSSERA